MFTRLRRVAVAVVLGAVALVAASQAPAVAAPVERPAVAVHMAAAPVLAQTDTQDPGPKLDPEESAKADSDRTKKNFIVGGIALVLLLTVIWGRRVRTKRRNAE